MGTPLKALADLTGVDIFKVDTSKAKREKKEMGLYEYPPKGPADLTGADIFKVDTSKAKREEKEMAFHGYLTKSPLRPHWGRHFQSGYKQS